MALSQENIALINAHVKPTGFLDYRDYLRGVYQWLKANLDSYSYILFAEDLGFSRTNVLHLVVQGKRPLTAKAADKIVEVLHLPAVQKNYLECMVHFQNSRDAKLREEYFQKMLAMKSKTLNSEQDRAKLEFFSEWYHPAIYEMTRLSGFNADPRWIADRLQLRIRPEQARKSLQLLEALNLIAYNQTSGKYEATDSNISTGDEVASVAVIRYHQKLIEMGKESITRVPEPGRDISAITVCVSEATAQRMKQEIQTFRKRLLAIAEESRNNDTVLQMNIQLFPLTK